MSKELVTVVLPTKNSERFMHRIVKSLKNQEGPLEVLIVDCVSTDKTLEIASTIGATIISEPDSSPCESWAKGIKMAKGDIITVIGADDYLLPDAIKIVRNTFAENFNSWVVGRCIILNKGELYNVVGDKPIDRETMLESNLVPCPSSFFRKQLYESVGGVDTGLTCAQDYDLWMRFLRNSYMPKQIPDILSAVEFHGDNASIVMKDKMASEAEFIKNKYRL